MARVVANNKKEQDDIAKLLADQRNQPAHVDEGSATPNIDRLRSKSRQRRQAEAAQVQQAGQAE